ncbi:MAG: hypothetical protein CMD85_03640 [Gammaproteobacteria bacterium]|nr:hypothetical protein [Gammaproteobacteria bacterium]|tara:strand:+ start:672 stop:1040 length:369 start_codon:yes stop_codon:yes gene_type:complete
MKNNNLRNITIKSLALYSSLIIGFLLLVITHLSIWAGEYSYSNLNILKDDLKQKQKLILELERKNMLLEEEKRRLSSSRNAIEGLARQNLGLIKPGETFYKFKKQTTSKEEIELAKKQENSE